MRIGEVDLDAEVLVVAEIGNNHEGDVALGQELIGLAAEAGAGAVKFQTYRTEELVSRGNVARFEQLKLFELSHDEFERLAATASDEGVMFLSTPFDLGSAEFLASLVPAFKIGSCENTFYPLLETVARFGKPVLLSGGMMDVLELADSKARIEEVWRRQGVQQELAVLHCVTSYPVPPEEANLAAISRLREALGCTVGYSDHTLGIEAAAVSVALGARVVEKHFTVDKHYSKFRDHQLSADPNDMAQLVRKIREIEALLGSGEKRPQPSELAVMETVRRSIVARRDLPAGAIVTWDDLAWVRPGGGLAPGEEHLITGRRLRRSMAAGDEFSPRDLEETEGQA